MSTSPAFVLLGGGFQEMSGWTFPSQATPTIVQSLKPANGGLYTNVDSSYDASSNGLKAIYQLVKPQIVGGGTFLCGCASAGQTKPALKTTYSVSTALGQSKAFIRCRPILSAFDYTLTTWNTMLAMTIDTAAAIQTMCILQSTTNSGVQMLFGSTTDSQLGFIIPAASVAKCYGFILDVEPIVTQTNITLEESNCSIFGLTTRKSRPRFYKATA